MHGDTEFVAGHFDETNPAHTLELAQHLNEFTGDDQDNVEPLSGELEVVNGAIVSDTAFTILHSRSIAENVEISLDGEPFSGTLAVVDGSVDSSYVLTGDSLIHSVSLTQEAFKQSVLGEGGAYLVAIGLLLFAFSTAIAWSYYGDRAVTYLLGSKAVLPYRIFYCLAFFCCRLHRYDGNLEVSSRLYRLDGDSKFVCNFVLSEGNEIHNEGVFRATEVISGCIYIDSADAGLMYVVEVKHDHQS